MSQIEPKSFVTKDGKRFVVRTVLPDDAEKVLDYTQVIIEREPYILTAPEEFSNNLSEQKRFIETVFHETNELMIIAEYAGEVIGFLNFHQGRRKKIQHTGTFGMSVKKEWRNQRVGEALLVSLIEWAQANPIIEKLGLEVAANNQPAIRLYQRNGFIEEGRKIRAFKIDSDRYCDLILMARFV
ncbi:GNAT family N-acetyltransferase [Thermoflavimicrobium dichotomicum]|uniref:Protein N-acetyltransferase, RimJ/RimL family n=1 Tax=Thermoflavimicrobium dichotomicum TaxID=46223 RepID=A0A1I3RXA9_9BACL|nr:GNAT family protein [Thermoflavimicrobium dichotomicum]SFJ49906.1 Protein N-acetyltransferase, RimJ/RimL family [Thermoflavimicrobium dichotomicum]